MTDHRPRALPTAQEVFEALPPPWVEPDARARIRTANTAAGRRIAALDDDPTGSQTVHGIDIVTAFEPAQYEAALARPGSTCFVLTNTRSLPQATAAQLTHRIGRDLFELARHLDAPIEVLSRSDSTLRGHVVAEVRALDTARTEILGRGFDGVLLIPAFFEAGRFTVADIHWARVGGELVPAGRTEFARDASFGYTSCDLRDFVVEKSGGTLDRSQIRGISLEDIRLGGPQRVTEILRGVSGGAFVVVNAAAYADLEVLVLGALLAEQAGSRFLYRVGPSFPQVLAGLTPRPPLTAADLWPAGHPGGHGLVVVGSHVDLTGRQVDVARARGGLAEVELDVPALTDPQLLERHVTDVARQVHDALGCCDVLLCTSRTLHRGADAEESLAISRTVSDAVVDVVTAALAARPSWMIAKGGITSHDVAVRSLRTRRAHVLGQALPGIVSIFQPVEAAPDAIGMPYVVFPGNVGDDDSLAHVIDLVTGRRPGRSVT